jgi:hypothetical protein
MNINLGPEPEPDEAEPDAPPADGAGTLAEPSGELSPQPAQTRIDTPTRRTRFRRAFVIGTGGSPERFCRITSDGLLS